MEANPVRIVQYFDGEKQSIIPLFQRPYTWNKRNWESLWDDIMSYYDGNISSSSHFMGAVVSIPARTVPIGVTKHLVIDGQQRLTTVAILLCAYSDEVGHLFRLKSATHSDEVGHPLRGFAAGLKITIS